MKINQYKSSNEGNALGTSLEILKSSGDNIFKKIHKMQIPQSSNAISPSLEISSKSLGAQISKASQAMTSTIKSLTSSGKRVFEKMPKMNTSSNAMGESYKSLKVSSEKIFKKISKPSNS